MKPPKYIFALLILFASFQICFAQTKSNVKLFDKFGSLNYSDLRGRMDNFLVALRDEPNSVGLIVFNNQTEPMILLAFYEDTLKYHVKARRFPENRIRFVKAIPQSDFKVEFWISRNDEKPVVEEAENHLVLNPSNCYLFADNPVFIYEGKLEYSHESECILEAVNFKLLAEYLNANPEMNAQIFVYNNKMSRANQLINLIVSEATKDYEISRNRFKIKYGGIDQGIAQLPSNISTVKVWLVPKGEKK
jgi:hypothetical protein